MTHEGVQTWFERVLLTSATQECVVRAQWGRGIRRSSLAMVCLVTGCKIIFVRCGVVHRCLWPVQACVSAGHLGPEALGKGLVASLVACEWGGGNGAWWCTAPACIQHNSPVLLSNSSVVWKQLGV
jgi:hypothetical protein